MILAVSFVVGLLGVLASRAWMRRVALRPVAAEPHVAWSLGLLGPMPGWLIAFVALLGTSPAPRLQGVAEAAWILSAAAALLGTIVTEALLRRAAESVAAPGPLAYWRYGVAALIPAWVIAVLGNLAKG